MLSKSQTEDDIRRLFEKYGPIEECTILRYFSVEKWESIKISKKIISTFRTPEGSSKGCAFIKVQSVSQAHSAIQQMHGSQTMPVSFNVCKNSIFNNNNTKSNNNISINIIRIDKIGWNITRDVHVRNHTISQEGCNVYECVP